jgi:hypothetical protein
MGANVFRSSPKANIGRTHSGERLHSKSNIMRTAALRHERSFLKCKPLAMRSRLLGKCLG